MEVEQVWVCGKSQTWALNNEKIGALALVNMGFVD
jgi:hypothetical protein